MRLIIAEQAVQDLTVILEYIGKDRPESAKRIEERFWREFDLLCEMPGVGHRRSDVSDERYRFKRVKSFIICYRVDGADLRVTRVLHGARDFRQIEFE